MITKKAAIDSHNAKIESQAKELEDALDASITRGGISHSVDASKYSQEVIDLVKDIYEIGGWTVRHERNQRDEVTIFLS